MPKRGEIQNLTDGGGLRLYRAAGAHVKGEEKEGQLFLLLFIS